MSNAAEIFAAMGEAIQGAEGRRLRRKFKGSVVFVITDSEEKYFLDLRSEDSTAGKGGDLPSGAAPDLTVRVSEANMIAMITKKLNPQQAFMKGKLKIKGKMPLAMKLTTVLAATAKKLPQSKL